MTIEKQRSILSAFVLISTGLGSGTTGVLAGAKLNDSIYVEPLRKDFTTLSVLVNDQQKQLDYIQANGTQFSRAELKGDREKLEVLTRKLDLIEQTSRTVEMRGQRMEGMLEMLVESRKK